ncbi:membrane-anchored junction protein [Acomys russatus]|uniref:membrane-anchored junction protein n=1 Tax=Acomys russatus TaxID=60746 RepID=UPI0021E1CEB3|nr:membrane-anchored junction protein [Acomys russatus]
MSLKPFTYPFPEIRFLHAGPNVYKFKIRYGDSIRGEEIEAKEVIIQELEDSVRVVLANMDNLQPFVTEHFIVFPYKSKWERVSHLRFKHGEVTLTPYPFVFTLYVEMKWFAENLPSGKPTDDIPLELVLAEKDAEEAAMKKQKLMKEPSPRGRLQPHRAKTEPCSEDPKRKKALKATKRSREGEAQQEYQDAPASDATDVQEQDAKLEHSLPGLAVPPLQHCNPPPLKEAGASGLFGFLSTLFPFRYFFRKSSQ